MPGGPPHDEDDALRPWDAEEEERERREGRERAEALKRAHDSLWEQGEVQRALQEKLSRLRDGEAAGGVACRRVEAEPAPTPQGPLGPLCDLFGLSSCSLGGLLKWLLGAVLVWALVVAALVLGAGRRRGLVGAEL
ncbi:unnamed protein product [Prorocentrum cordatum]|uniref:Uncharacterized protein n=1 Tax=Prorocentrum cordatum TaxID=2364126 RepID=A0ABN9SQK7_9DINO|nr:unnamed protein product [Polarella glacialis]|mmetsp:Transcript_117165/g.318079  ORF Transcript_117165/g.318079 Transcript_117165/m.318079 type:complete len:136 (-) Transcript_117165:29-436(-)